MADETRADLKHDEKKPYHIQAPKLPFKTQAAKDAYLAELYEAIRQSEAEVVYQEYPKWVDGVLCQDKEAEDAVKHPKKAKEPEKAEPEKPKASTTTKFA